MSPTVPETIGIDYPGLVLNRRSHQLKKIMKLEKFEGESAKPLQITEGAIKSNRKWKPFSKLVGSMGLQLVNGLPTDRANSMSFWSW